MTTMPMTRRRSCEFKWNIHESSISVGVEKNFPLVFLVSPVKRRENHDRERKCDDKIINREK